MHQTRQLLLTVIGVATLAQSAVSQKFIRYGIPDFTNLNLNCASPQLGYPKVNLVEFDKNGNIHLAGDYYFETLEQQNSSSSNANPTPNVTCIPFSVSSHSHFEFKPVSHINLMLGFTKRSSQSKVVAHNFLNKQNASCAYQCHSGPSGEKLSEVAMSTITDVARSGKYALIQKLSETNPSCTSAVIDTHPIAGSNPNFKILKPLGGSRGFLLCEKHNEDRTATDIHKVIGLAREKDSGFDRLAVWKKNTESQSFNPPVFAEEQQCLILPNSCSVSGGVIVGALYADAKTINETDGKRIFPVVIDCEEEPIVNCFYYKYVLDEKPWHILIPGSATHCSSDGEYAFATISKPELAKNAIKLDELVKTAEFSGSEEIQKAEKNIPDHASIYFNLTQKGNVSTLAGKMVEATISGDFLRSLKEITLDYYNQLIEEKKDRLDHVDEIQAGLILASIAQIKIDIEDIKKWHFVEVFTSTYDAEGQLTIAGLGINPVNQYELFTLTIPGVDLYDALADDVEDDGLGVLEILGYLTQSDDEPELEAAKQEDDQTTDDQPFQNYH